MSGGKKCRAEKKASLWLDAAGFGRTRTPAESQAESHRTGEYTSTQAQRAGTKKKLLQKCKGHAYFRARQHRIQVSACVLNKEP